MSSPFPLQLSLINHLHQRYPDAMIVARCNQCSHFAREVGVEYDINRVSLTQLIEENFPQNWLS